MRFIEHGPDIPDELLLALDEERVVFFCGAGVSQAGAGLPGFLKLAELVLADLRVLPTEPAHQILNIAKPNKEPMPTPVSADLIFGELEKDFYPQDIQASVAKHLITENAMKPTAHSDLVKLATTHDGHTRLVTTNFDRLFENCAPDVKTWQYPNLPDLTKDTEFEGLVYLHGRVNKQYTGCDEEFILSTAEFGRAYLAEGSATRFFKQIIAEYTVVFVGYGAEDPPVRYLLEAFNKEKRKSKDKKNNIYAFQSGTQEEAEKKWENRGVTVIPYDEADKHKALWNTFSEWVVRTKTTEAWQDDIMKIAVQGPEGLLPFDREKVLQMVATEAGAKRFGADDNPPPATWLNVFDFEPNYRDKCEAGQENMVSLIGTQTPSAGKLPHRFYTLGNWIASVSDQPAAVWWAVRKTGIHSRVQDKIKEALGRKTDCPPYIKLAWQYIFDSWSPKPDDRDIYQPSWCSFVSDVEKLGWDATMVRRYEELTKPWIVAKPSFTRDEIPPQKDAETDFVKLVDLDVLYNDYLYAIKIPDEWLAKAIKAFKRNLDEAIRLERERHYHLYRSGRTQIQSDYYATMGPTIAPWDKQSLSVSPRTDDLTDAVRYYTFLFKRLLEYDLPQAKAEVETWDEDDNTVYARLRMWSCQFTALVPDEEVGNFLSVISRKAFWDDDHLPDFLRTLKARWARMPDATRLAIEARILQGSERWENETQKEYTKYKAWYIFRYLAWLKDKECVLSATAEKEMVRLQKINPEYNPEHAKDVDQPRHTKVHTYFPNSDPSVFTGLAIADIMPKAEEVMRNNDYIPEHNDPFSGLCEKNSVRALAVLRREANRGEYPLWAWLSFLDEETRKKDTTRMKRFTAELITRMPDKKIVGMQSALARWLLSASEQLMPACIPVFQQLTKRFIRILQKNHKIQTTKSYHYTSMQLIDTPAWYLVNALFNDPRIKELKVNQSPPSDWMDIAEDMLKLPDDLGRDVLMLFIRRLNWFYYVDSQWTLANLLPPLFDKNPNTIDAWWLGYLLGVENLLPLDLFEKIKPQLFSRASNPDAQKSNNIPMIANVILSNWSVDGEQRISNKEFHKILLEAGDIFRFRTLLNIESFCENDPHPPHWKEKRSHLFENVWPLHMRAKTPKTIGKLISFAFVDDPAFPQMSKTILRLLGQEISQGSIHSFLYGTDNKNTVDKHPKIALEILHKIVLQDAFLVSHRIKEILERIATTDPELKHDPRFKELQRRWAVR